MAEPTTPKLREKCGVIGVWTRGKHASYYARRGLAALQHRGQESAGISLLNTKGKIITHKGMGLIPNVITGSVLKKLGEGHMAIGHNRYGTSGKSSLDNAQPIQIKNKKLEISIGHNGNIPRVAAIRKRVKNGKTLRSDTALIAGMLMQQKPNYPTWEETLAVVLPEFKGAYCLVIMTNDGSLLGVRDPYGIRPFCLGRLHDGWIMASESVALDTIGAAFVRDIAPGEIIHIDATGKITSSFFGEPKAPKHCLFEYIYFARPDSFMNGRRVRTGREESGRRLAKRIQEKKIHLDAIVPTFDSGYPAAKGAAYALNVPMIDAITTSHYVGRTFIHPGQENRIAAVNGKHNVVPDEIFGKRIVVVDDSAVRLTTSRMLIDAFRRAGAKKVYLALASPPIVDQCDLGIDMRSKKDLPAARHRDKPLEIIEKKIAEHIGADGVIYLPIEETAAAMGGTKDTFYYTPFGGPHPIRGKQPVFPKRTHKITNKPRICVLISGTGTNLQSLIDAKERGNLNAEIVSVVSNKQEAYGLERAKKHGIPATHLEFTGQRNDPKARTAYENALLQHIQSVQAEIVIMAGWMQVLGNDFVKALQKAHIPLINLHPALLTTDDASAIATSRGRIPVIRGAHAIQEAFEKNLPVSGVTIHQVLPDTPFDTGPVVMKAEVRRTPDDSLDAWEKKIHETEHQLFPTAVKRILHVMHRYNIDVSKGDFPW